MRRSKSGYYVNRHSCFLLQYHLVLVTKYRHPTLVEPLRSELIAYTTEYFNKQGCHIMEVNCDTDHMHILFEAPPQISLSNFVNAFKSASSRIIRKNHSDFLEKFYWKPYFWSTSYFIGTVSEHTTEIVANYIRNQ